MARAARLGGIATFVLGAVGAQDAAPWWPVVAEPGSTLPEAARASWPALLIAVPAHGVQRRRVLAAVRSLAMPGLACTVGCAVSIATPVALLADRERVVLWRGRVDGALAHVLEDFRAGVLTRELAGAGVELARAVAAAERSGAWAEVGRLSARHRTRWPASAEGWVGGVLAMAGGVPGDATELVEGAARALAGRGEYLARVVAAAVRSGTVVADAPLERLVDELRRAAPADVDVAWAAVEVAAASSSRGRAESAAAVLVEAAKGDPERLVGLAERLADARLNGCCRDAVVLALELATAARPEEPDLLQRQLRLLVAACQLDAARQVVRSLVRSAATDPRVLNGLAWRLLTEEPFAGEFDAMALEAVRAMQRVDGWRSYWRLDTAALAAFRNGLLAEAVELQGAAVEGCDPAARERYAARLADYRSALAAAPVR